MLPILLQEWPRQAAHNAVIARRSAHGARRLVGQVRRYETDHSSNSWLLDEAVVLTLDR